MSTVNVDITEVAEQVDVTYNETTQQVTIEVTSGGGGASGDMEAATYDPAGVTEQLVGLTASQTIVNKTIDGLNNTLSVQASSQLSGNIPVTNLNGGSGASGTTFWRGDGTWANVAAAIEVQDEGAPLTTGVTLFNFVGDGVIVTEPVADEVMVTINQDVTKVGTPVNNEIAVWTGDGTLEGTPSVTFDSVGGTMVITGNLLITTPLAETEGGTGQANYTTGELLYASASNTLNRLSVGSPGEVLTVSGGGLPSWQAAAGGGGASIQTQFQYDNTTTSGDPGAGNFRLNNTTIASATSLFLSEESKAGSDLSAVIGALGENDRLYLQNIEDSNERLLLTITSVTDNGTWFDISFTVEDSNGPTWTDGKEFGFLLLFSAPQASGIQKKDIWLFGGF